MVTEESANRQNRSKSARSASVALMRAVPRRQPPEGPVYELAGASQKSSDRSCARVGNTVAWKVGQQNDRLQTRRKRSTPPPTAPDRLLPADGSAVTVG